MSGHGTNHKSEKDVLHTFSDFFYWFCESKSWKEEADINKTEYSQKEKELLTSIERYKKQQSILNHSKNKPNMILRIELELYIENIATYLNLDYKKERKPTNTIYRFSMEDRELQVKVLYRYGTFYTRHQALLPE